VLFLILEVRGGCCKYWRWEWFVFDIGGERGCCWYLRWDGCCCWIWRWERVFVDIGVSTTTPSHLQY
jgi:hypothetical protein